MKKFSTTILSLSCFFIGSISSSNAADHAYDFMILEASIGKNKPVTLAIRYTLPKEPGGIAFAKLKENFFVGQRVLMSPLQINTKSVEVIIEDVEPPIHDKQEGIDTQKVHKRILNFEADGKPHTVEVNGKNVSFKVYTVGGVGESNKVMIDQD